MMIKSILKLQTYGCELIFILSDDIKKDNIKLYKKYGLEGREDSDEYDLEGVLITPNMNTYVLVIDNKYLSHNTIAHEVYHATVRITEDRDIVDEEAQAWLAGHISGFVYKFIEKKNLQVKHG